MFRSDSSKHAVRSIALLALLLCSVTVWPANKEQRIRLKSHATEARVSARLTPKNDEAIYVIRADAGRHLTLTLSGAGPLSGVVTSPSGKKIGRAHV